jgi:hypothetical protein
MPPTRDGPPSFVLLILLLIWCDLRQCQGRINSGRYLPGRRNLA